MRTLVEKEIRLLLPAFAAALALAILPVWLLPFDSGNPGAYPSFLVLVRDRPAGALLIWTGDWPQNASFSRGATVGARPYLVDQNRGVGRLRGSGLRGLVALRQPLFPPSTRPHHATGVSGPLRIDGGRVDGGWPMDDAAAAADDCRFLAHPAHSDGDHHCLCRDRRRVLDDLHGAGPVCGGRIFPGPAAIPSLAGHGVDGRRDCFWRQRAAAEQSARREHRPWAALLRKEVQLQQVTLVGMGGLFMLHLGVVVLRKAGAHVFSKTTLMVLDMFFLLWLVVPMLAGSLSVAEERQLGTLDGLLCLPVSRRLQFVVKLFFVLRLGRIERACCCARPKESAARWVSGAWTRL